MRLRHVEGKCTDCPSASKSLNDNYVKLLLVDKSLALVKSEQRESAGDHSQLKHKQPHAAPPRMDQQTARPTLSGSPSACSCLSSVSRPSLHIRASALPARGLRRGAPGPARSSLCTAQSRRSPETNRNGNVHQT
eukprot:116242-Pleurochrysis_carterae.AAC.1